MSQPIKITNLVLNLLASGGLAIDLFLMGFNFLIGMGYMEGTEFLKAGALLLTLSLGNTAALLGGILVFALSKKLKPKTYTIIEIVINILAFAGFAAMVLMILIQNIKHFLHPNPYLSTGYNNFSPTDLLGLAICTAGLVVTIIGAIKAKKKAQI